MPKQKLVRKVGGIYFWKLGALGGSFYIAKRKPEPHPLPLLTEMTVAALIGLPGGWFLAAMFF